MASVNVNLSCDLQHPVRVQYLDGNLFSMDNDGNTINIMVYDNGAPAQISGSVAANVIRADGGTVAVSGAIDGNRAYVSLPQACYAVPGALSVIIKLTNGTTVTTIAAFVANVYQSSTDTVIDPGTIIPSIENLIAAIDEAVDSIPPDYSALTAEVSNLRSAIQAIENVEMIPFSFTFEEGKSISSTGHFGDNTKRIATRIYTPITDARYVTYNISDGYRLYGAFYNGMEDSSSFVSSFGWLTGSGIIEIPSTAVYMRVSFASVGDASALTINDAINLKMKYEAQYTFDMNHALVYRGQVGTGQYAIHSTLAEVTEIGLYNISTGSAPSDMPNGFSSGTLAVIPAYNTNSTTTYDTQKIQIIIRTSPFGMVARHNSTGGVWRDWYSLDVSQMPVIVEQTKWLALGDSITYGVYSTGPDTKVDSTNGWVKRLADSLGYTLNNQGVRGMGYIAVGGNGITWESVLETVEAYTASDYNLVTVALGINDYNTSSVSLSDLETVVKSSIQRLATKFPNARLVFITPLNSNRRGDASTKYCYGQQYGGRSLKDIADKIKECCDLYGVECIYATDGFLMNVYNIATLLPDSTHPSDYAHTLIAKNMAHILLN